MLNRLHAAMIDGRGVEHLQAVFQESAQFGFGHFAHEEELMTAARYPGLWEHTQLHNELRALGMEFVKRFEQGELTMTVALAVALLQRIKNHIITADCPMGAYLAAHGGPPAGT